MVAIADNLNNLAAIIAVGLLAVECELHESTGPDALREIQRREVEEYVRLHPEASAEEIGQALVLPTWSIECRLCELRGEPTPYRAGKLKHDTAHPWKAKLYAQVQAAKAGGE